MIYTDYMAALLLLAWALAHWQGTTREVIGLAMALIFGILWVSARANLRKKFGVRPKPKGLVVTGIYSKFGHPIYLFSFLAFAGVMIAIHNRYLYLLLLVLLVIQVVRAKKEEALLLEEYGQQYKEYKKRTWF